MNNDNIIEVYVPEIPKGANHLPRIIGRYLSNYR